MRIRLDTLLVGHEAHELMIARGKVDDLLTGLDFSGVRKTVIVNNSRPRVSFERLDDGCVIVGGDNSLREFTAWDQGLAYVERTRSNPDLVHFATSAFNALYTGYLSLFDSSVLEAAWRAGAAVGHLDFYDRPVEMLGRQSQEWLRTAYFFMPLSATRLIRSLVSFEDRASLFSGDPDQPFRRDAPICRRYQEYIMSWLTGEGTGSGVTWHSRFDLSEQTLDQFEAKTMSILNEHLLGVRLREAGIPVVDVNWLASQLRAHGPNAVDWSTRWEDQVAGRAIVQS